MTAMTLTCPDAVETVLPGAPRSVSEARALVRSELGASTLVVVANGIPSKSVSVTVN